MLLASLPFGRQRRYDLVLAFVPVALLAALVASWAFPISFHVATFVGAALVGIVLLAFVLRHPPVGR